MFKKIIKKLVNFDTIPAIFVIAFIGIMCAIIGHYGGVGFNWKWFLCLDLPLYIFSAWALYKAWTMYKTIGNKKAKENK